MNHQEHIYGVHNDNDAVLRWEIEEKIREVKGEHYEYLESLRGITSKQFDWIGTEAYLREELRLAKIEHDGPF